jgi:hypothetical protein
VTVTTLLVPTFLLANEADGVPPRVTVSPLSTPTSDAVPDRVAAVLAL